jgi:hypothetical protein
VDLVGLDDLHDDEDDEDYGSPDAQELEGLAYRYVQIVPDVCTGLFFKAVEKGVNHPVVFLCDVADHMGVAIAQKFTSQGRIQESIDRTDPESGQRPGISFWYDMENLASREPSLAGAIRARMERMVIGYFPIVVVAKGGFNAFPWPIPLREKSKLNLLPG